ncbi:MAG: entericidin A/B family lipoprotein [Pseudomonadota bacterium]
MKTNLLALIFLGLLSACATVEGLGEDIQAGGEALSNAANSAQDDESGGY